MKKQFQSKSVPRGTRTIWRYLGALFILFTFAIGQMWADSVTFTAADMSEQTSGAKKGKITVYCPTKAGDQQAYKSGGSAVKHSAISLGSSADTAVIVPQSGKSVQFRADANYKITGISIFAAANKDSICGEPIVIWAGAVNNTPAYVGTIEAPSRAGTSDPDPIVVTGIPNNATAFALYRRIKYNSSTGVIGSGSNFGRSQQTWNIFSVTVTYESTTPATTYTVTYSAGDGSVKEGKSLPTQAAVAAGTEITLASADDLEKEGKEFDGWLCDINSTKYAAGAKYTMTAAATTFTAQWQDPAPKYTVTLMPAGGTCESYTGWTYDDVNNKYTKEVSSGTELALPTFTKDNRTFKTWRNGAVDVTSPITVTADVTLTAVWNATIENVIYSWEGAEGGATEVGGTATGSVDGLVNVAKSGYYCLQINGNTSYDKYVQITLSGEEKVKTGDKIRYTGFYTNTGTKNAAVKMRASGGTAIFTGANLPRIEEASPRTDTYVVPEGINTASVQITRHQTQTSSFLTKLQIIRPTLVEEANIRTVTFNYNDGVTANVTVEVASGATVAAPADPTRAHYRFHEWQLGGVAYDFSTAVTSNITLTADWTQLYTVTYAKGEESATGDAPTQDELAAGEKFTVAANPFAYDGHDFSTWNDGSADVAPGTEYTMGAANVTLTAQWITATTKVTVTYKDGETTLGSEEITINTGNPVGYATYQTRNLATFDGWYNDPDLAEGHKIADISTLTASADVNVYGKWNYQYASSVNIEQWTLDNGKGVSDAQKETQTGALVSLLGTRKFASNIAYDKGNIELDSLNDDPGKTNRNYAYLGLKVKKSGKMLDFRLAKDSYVKIKFGNVAATPKVSINGADYADMELTAGVYSYTATGNDYVSIKTASDGAVVFQQVMINEDIAAVTLPWRVTYNANGGTCATAEAIWSGSALTLPDVTPAVPADYTFAGWYDEEIGGELKGAAGASYTPTDNTTLFAHFAPVEYAIAYDGNGATSGSMVAGAAGWGTLVTPDANAFVKSGNVFSGWVITKTSDGSATGITFSEGKFEMPKYDVTLVAQWDDVSKVAVIVETNVKYESLADAVAAATDGQTIQLLQNIEQANGVAIAKNLTLDLNGKTYTCTSGSNVNYRAIKITAGNVTIQNGSIVAVPTANFEGGCYGPIRIEGATANVTLEDLTLQNGRHYGLGIKLVEGYLRMEDCTVISENGGGGLEVGEATADVINCTFTQTGLDNAHAWISTCLATCDNGVLNVQGGTYTSEHYSMYVYTSGGEMNVESGSFTGDVVNKVTLSSYPDAVGTVNISGGSFEGAGGNPIQFTTDNSGATSIAISGGTFDAPVENEYCAPGYVPSGADPVTGKYTVEPKDGVCLVKITPTSTTKGTQTGLYPDGDELTINLSSGMNLGGSGKYIGVKATENFQEGDVLHLNMSTYQNNQNATAYVYGDKNATEFLFDTEEKCDENKDYYITLPAAVNGHKELYIVRTEGNKWNGGPSVMEVTRAMKPMLTAITIDGRDGVIDEANKAVAVQIPYEANLAALTVVPTIVWNEAAATNSIVVNDGSAWIEGANTYKLTDKDGDYTVYTITLTRDVQKHAVKFYDGETLLETLEVEDGTSIAAGDVPADPEKEDYLFQGWAETVDGAAVDVTSFTISAAKNFYAKWAADGAIKLINKTSGAVNEDGYFITGVTATEANSEKAAAWGGTQGTSISGVNALGKIVQYNATTNQTKIKIKVYNTNSSDKYVYIHKIIEGKTTEESVETLTATSKTVVESEFYEFNDTKNRSFYLTTNSTDVKILQVKVIDDGATPMKQAGEAGYSLNLNKGRVVYYANADVAFEGLALNSASNYSVISSSELQTTKNFSFSISTPVLLKVTTNTAKYYVSQDPDEDGTTATAVTDAGTAEFNLTTTGTWYLVPSTTSNVKYTNIAFELPKAATPVIETQPATNHTFNPGDMTATVVATVSEGTLHYQWYKKATVGDDEEVGTDAATLTTTTEGTYYVVVTNVLAGHQNTSVTSDEAELGYRVTNDATLMALSYGTPATAIALEDGVYTYNVELAKGTTDVPALAATATMDGYADVDINDAAEFVNYEASSTVTVKSEDLTETNVYTVNFYVKHDLPQVDVTASTVWDMTNVSASEINLASMTPSKQNVLLLLANIEGVNNNASFNSQALMFEGQRIGRTENNVKYVSGQYVQFNVTVPGMVSVTFASNGSAQRTILINGKQCSRTTNDGTYIKYDVAVEPGSVEIEDVQGYVRISKIEFKAEYSHNRPGLNPANIGTLCWTNNAILGGATLYELAGKNENNKLVFDEVAENRLEAGKPYIFVPENGNTEIKLYNTDTEAALTQGDLQAVNGMHGTFVNLSSADGDLLGNYVISKNHYIYVDSDNVTLKAYRAYITSLDDVEPVNNGPAPINGAPRRRIVMGAQGEQVATGIDNLEASEKPLKLMIDGQMYILRGEKLFDATGRLVK